MEFKFQTKFEFKQWKRNEKQKRKRRSGPPTQLTGPAFTPPLCWPTRARARPSQPAQDTAHAQSPVSPASSRCHLAPHISRALLTRVPLCFARSRCPLDPACQSHPVYSVVFSTPTLNRLRDQAPTAVAGRARGSRPGHGPVSPLCRAYATVREPLDATKHASTARSPSAIGAWSSPIKLGPQLP